jgi:hypothetical protein
VVIITLQVAVVVQRAILLVVLVVLEAAEMVQAPQPKALVE